jgi:outer membrane protein insertion porin family
MRWWRTDRFAMAGAGGSQGAAGVVLGALVVFGAWLGPLAAQQPPPQQPPAERNVRIDSIALRGNVRVTDAVILSLIGIQPGQLVSIDDIQRAQKALYASRDFRDVRVFATPDSTLVFELEEQPVLRTVTIQGLEHLSERRVRDTTGLAPGVPYSPQTVVEAQDFIRSELSRAGIPFARIEERLTPVEGREGITDLVLEVTEGNRVTVAEVVIEGNETIDDEAVIAALTTRPEGFLWFKPGTFDPARFEADVNDALPRLYSQQGRLDFQVLSDTLIVDPETGKARLEILVEEGPQYRVSDFIIEGNQYVTRERIESFFNVQRGGLLGSLGLAEGQAGDSLVGRIFDAVAFEEAVTQIESSYANEGYIFVQVEPFVTKREPTAPGEEPTVRVGVSIVEGSPAIVNRIDIVGNDYTHDWVIRDKIFLLPGDTYSQDRVIQSYRSIESLGFFETPLSPPDVVPNRETGLVDITFRVRERQTGSVNFGTSVGGGTGLAGFIGYDHPNLFGQGKEGHLRWDFGRYLNNFTLSFTDPALFQTLVSGTVSLFNSTDRFIQFQNGSRRRVGASFQAGFPIPGDVRSRVFVGYSLSRTELELREGVEDISLFGQADGVQSQLQMGVTRNTLNHPLFPTVGSRLSWNIDLNGGVLGGDGNFTKHQLESTWWVPVGQFGDIARPVRFALGVSLRGGAIFGDATRFPFDRFWMGGVQFGQQIRGYDETSITPFGFFPEQSGGIDDARRLGDGFVSMTAEYAMRLNDMISASAFFDAGNVWREPRDIDPTRLFRGAGVGIQIVTPFGPIGVDYAYGFDKTVPGWQLHFRMGPGY